MNFMLARDRFVQVKAGACLDLFPGQIHPDVKRAQGGLTQSQQRNKDFVSG